MQLNLLTYLYSKHYAASLLVSLTIIYSIFKKYRMYITRSAARNSQGEDSKLRSDQLYALTEKSIIALRLHGSNRGKLFILRARYLYAQIFIIWLEVGTEVLM